MATATTFTFTNFNRVPKPWAGGPILLPDKVSVQVGYAADGTPITSSAPASASSNAAPAASATPKTKSVAAPKAAAAPPQPSAATATANVNANITAPVAAPVAAANIAPKPFSALDAANSAAGIYSVQNVAAAAAAQGAAKVVAESSSVVESSVSTTVQTPSLQKTELKRELSKTVEVQESAQMCSTLEFSRDVAVEAPAAAEVAATESAAPAAAPAPAPVPVVTAPPKMPSIPKGPRKPTLGSAGSAKMQQPIFSGKVPICAVSGKEIRGPFILALGKTFSPDSFICANNQCCANLQNCGFVEEGDQLFCEVCYEAHFAPKCAKCNLSIKHDCVNAMGQTFHPECFVCFHTKKPIGTGGFHIEDGNVYSTEAWNELFTTKCYGCEFPIEPSDRWVEALGQNWHAECFNCAVCGVNLEGQSFYAKGGRPYCKKHASSGFR